MRKGLANGSRQSFIVFFISLSFVAEKPCSHGRPWLSDVKCILTMVKWVKWVQCPESYNLEAPISICAQAMQNGWLWSESFQAWDNFIVKRRKGRNMHGKFFNCHDGRILSSDSWLKRRWAQFLYISSVFSMPWDSGTICSKWFRMVSIDGNGHETKLHQTSSHCSMFSFAFVFCVQYLSCQEVGCASLQATKKENNWSITTILITI